MARLPLREITGQREYQAMLHIRTIHAVITVAVIISAGAFPSGSEAAVPLAPIEVSAAGGTTILTIGTVTGTACNGTAGCETTTSKAGRSLNLSTRGSTSGNDPANASGLAEITVFYEIIGPVSGVPVPLVISGSASTSAHGPDAEGTAYIEYGDGDLYTCSATIAGPCGSEPSSGSLDSVVFTNQVSNTLYDLQVIVSGDSGLGTGSFSAKISGISLAIEPSWLASNPGYRLKFSSNVHVSQAGDSHPEAGCVQGDPSEVRINCASSDQLDEAEAFEQR
jgi:hypothetical protein